MPTRQVACELVRRPVGDEPVHEVMGSSRKIALGVPTRAVAGTRDVAVGRVADTLAGVVSWGRSAEPGVPPRELVSLYVAGAFHGTGVAAALLAHVLGDTPAHLWVFEANPRAHAFYAKWGFTFDGHRTIDPDTGVWERRLVRA